MDYEQAIEILSSYRNCMNLVKGECLGDGSCFKAKEIAISAMQKQIPQKPYIQSDGHNETLVHCCECLTCDSFLAYESDWKDEHYRYNYCPNCGQALLKEVEE